jgi:hypothetical protein
MNSVVVELKLDNGLIQHVGPFSEPDDASDWISNSGALPYFRTLYVQVAPEKWQKP